MCEFHSGVKSLNEDSLAGKVSRRKLMNRRIKKLILGEVNEIVLL